MRIFFVALFVILGANLGINLLDSNMSEIINERRETLEKSINQLIENQGEDAHCAAWIYTKNDCHLKDEDGEFDYNNNVEDADVIERIFDDVGNIDYIYQVIQECVDEVVEEQVMQQQQELAEVE